MAGSLVDELTRIADGEQILGLVEVQDAPAERDDYALRIAEAESVAGQPISGRLVGIPLGALKKATGEARRRWLDEGGEAYRRALLLLLPQVDIAWKKGGGLGGEEVHLNRLCLLRRPKCFEAWDHRGRLLRTMQSTPGFDVRREIDLCLECAARHPRNYLAWSHLLAATDTSACCEERRSEVEEAAADLLQRLREWAKERPSDHSSLSVAAAIANRLRASGRLTPDAFRGEVRAHSCLVADLIARRPGHEGHWAHRRWLASTAQLPAAEEFSDAVKAVTVPAPEHPHASPADFQREKRCAARYALWLARKGLVPTPDESVRRELLACAGYTEAAVSCLFSASK
eukprot:Hpha_TRINITY_DN16129_c1_g9::TRINITY_DN16129_c1_g9_i1::g.8399::m.8399/K14137/PTAR1; protein prenyltransferase alpha subunit repeat containing protein 1